jgi:hypothetical protein
MERKFRRAQSAATAGVVAFEIDLLELRLKRSHTTFRFGFFASRDFYD